MAKLYIDHRDVVHFDPTSDNRLAREAAIPKAAFLIAAATERHARREISTAVRRGENFDAMLQTLELANDVRGAAMAS
jgi:hypothetical protein